MRVSLPFGALPPLNPEDYAWSEWFVYPNYDIGEHEGCRFVYAPMPDSVGQLRGRWRYRPLSRPTAALFLEFAGWPETEGMDLKPLGSQRNEEAAKEWAEINGVLGLSASSPFTIFDEASDATMHSLGVYAIRPRTRNEGYGGLEETVEAFAREAWLANMTLRLYEAATNPEGPDVDAIASYMADQEDMSMPSTRAFHSETPDRARKWALTVVEEVVEDRMRGRVWPIPVRNHSGQGGHAGHRQGWAFDSLLGAMWLQMMWLMLGQPRRCEWCGRLLDVDAEQAEQLEAGTKDAAIGQGRKTRSDRRFCKSRGGIKDKCKADWNYYRGPGKSSRHSRKQARGKAKRASDS